MENRKKEIEEFYKEVFSDADLKGIILEESQKIKSEEDLERLIENHILPLVKKYKKSFSKNDLLEYEREMLRELSDEDLANVSGGRGIAIKPLLGLGIMAFSMVAGMSIESFATKGGVKGGNSRKPGTSQTSSKKKGTSSKKKDIKKAVKNDDDDYDYQYEEDDGIDVDSINPTWLIIEIDDDDGISFKYNGQRMSKATFFKFMNKFQKSGKIYSSKEINLSKALNFILLNKNVTEVLKDNPELLDEIYTIMRKLQKDKNVWETLPQEIKDKVKKFIKEYEKSHDDDDDDHDYDYDSQYKEEEESNNIDPDDIDITANKSGISFKHKHQPMTESEFFEFAKKYQENEIYDSGCDTKFNLEQTLKFILINEDLTKDFEDEQAAFERSFRLVSNFKHGNKEAWNKTPNKTKNKINTFLRKKSVLTLGKLHIKMSTDLHS